MFGGTADLAATCSGRDMKNHAYVMLSVILWGVSQFLVDYLLNVFSSALLILIRFLISGIILLLIQAGMSSAQRTPLPVCYLKPFRFIYLLTGGLGGFGYYLLNAWALSYSSVPFVSVMGGVLPVLAILFDRVIVKKKFYFPQILAAVISLIGIGLFSHGGKFTWNIGAAALIIGANICWLFYSYLKNKLAIGEDSTILGYEFIGAGLLSLLFLPTFKFQGPITAEVMGISAGVIVVSTILPYKLYLKGSKSISISMASMYLNLLPVTSLLPVFLTGNLSLDRVQTLGIILLILSAVIGKEPAPAREILPV